ncbi:porin [Polaromonas hydrogenivorans]|uniref:Porin n=1 Tax=Polaromonas hydrogenivorans TaxID=335476 RepID=A0AAU7M099_9BURK
MKKKTMVLSMAAAFALPAMAQSSVTLYGIADMAVTRVSDKNGVGSTEVNSGNLNTSRFGLRGSEDLGGGLNAIFNLESSISMDTGVGGSSTAFWNRAAWVGLSSKTMGRLTMGFQRPVIYDLLGPLSHTPPFGSPAARIDGAAIAGSALERFDNTIGTKRFANSVKYSTPDMAGFKVHGFVAMGEVAGASSSSGRTVDVGIGYKRGPLDAGLSYLKTKCSGVSGCTATTQDDTVLGLGAGYNFGPATLRAIYTRQENAKTARGNDADTMSVAVIVPMNAWQFAAGYQQLNDKTALNQDVKQVNLSAVYDLSKRTALYGIYAHQSVDNGGKAGISFLSGKDSQNQLSLGLRHFF